MEIVTEPDIRSAEGARRYAEELQLLLRTIGASDADMERGQMRVEANVSLRARGTETFGTRIEVKNMNSFRSVEHAVSHEIVRQAAVLEAGEALALETRGWSDDRGATYRMRVKETSDDYRYFPEPDLPPLHVEPGWLEEIRASIPELPAARRTRYRDEFGLSVYDAAVLVSDFDATRVFDALVAGYRDLDPTIAARWVIGEYLRLKRKYPAEDAVFVGNQGGLGEIITLVIAEQITPANAKEVFETHFAHGQEVAAIVEARGFRQISDAGALATVVDQVLAENPAAVADYRAGKAQAVGFLVGQVMKATRGQANAALAGAALRARLDAASESG
jgi:aspartyl-tRNA(Asn)/glutamyl-tRNA(Gln) amidotransferase subunit B